MDEQLKNINTLPVPIQGGYRLIPYKQLLYLKAEGNYTKLHFVEENKLRVELASKNLNYFEKALENGTFLRIHDSTVVNLTKVIKYFREGKEGRVELYNGQSLVVSRTRKDELLTLFGIKKETQSTE